MRCFLVFVCCRKCLIGGIVTKIMSVTMVENVRKCEKGIWFQNFIIFLVSSELRLSCRLKANVNGKNLT